MDIYIHIYIYTYFRVEARNLKVALELLLLEKRGPVVLLRLERIRRVHLRRRELEPLGAFPKERLQFPVEASICIKCARNLPH